MPAAWIGAGAAVLGALSSRGGGSSGSTTATQAPWQPQQPFLLSGFQNAQNLYNRGPYSFTANQSPFTLQAQQLQAQRALSPGSLTAQAQGQLGSTISGQYLNPSSNPYFAQGLNDTLGLAKSQIAGQLGGPAGQNLGNSGYQENLARGLGGIAANAYSNMYGQERQNQLNALNLAPSLDYANINQLANVGAQQQAVSQAEYQSPWSNLQQYQQAIGGGYGSQTQQPYFTNPLAGALGGALGGLSLYRGLGGTGSPFGGGSGGGSPWNPYQSFPGSGTGQPDFSAGYY